MVILSLVIFEKTFLEENLTVRIRLFALITYSSVFSVWINFLIFLFQNKIKIFNFKKKFRIKRLNLKTV